MAGTSEKPLTGIKVIELEGIGPGPQSGCILADFGADVVSVSRVVDGKIMAQGDPVARGKRSIALDLKSKAGMDAMKELVKNSDVFLEPFRPGVAEKLGLGPDDLSKLNPRLIYGRATGWGQGGDPVIEKSAGHDANYLALAGLLHFWRRGDEAPLPPANFAGDYAGGGVMLAWGILLAIIERMKSGKGQVIDAAMTDGAAYIASFIFQERYEKDQWGDPITNLSATHHASNWSQIYECKEDPRRPGRKEYISVQTAEVHFYAEFLKVLGLTQDDMPKRSDKGVDGQTWVMARKKIAAIMLTKTRDEWAELFRGTDACFSPVLNAEEAWEHPHNKARGTFAPSVSHPGKFEPAPAPKLSRTPGFDPRPDPIPGQHTKDVLMEIAGLGEAQASELINQGAALVASASKL